MSNVKSGIGLKSYEWSSLELLKGLSIEQIKSNPSKLEERRPFFWHDMSSEFDSINFLRYLFGRRDIQFSNEFIEFVCLWHLDEQNHYRGLRKINSVLYSMPEDMIDREIRSNSPDFSHIEDFMKDEFTILLSIAFDEVTSTRAYKQDVSFFDSFENESRRRQKLSATPDLSGTVLPLCLIPNSALKSAPPFKSVVPKASACAGLPA
ncbi:hypothetical protein QYP04_33450 [Pseudomonas aeruginosa]|nr:hypothetical protein [Pseudomonas aeruginosa]